MQNTKATLYPQQLIGQKVLQAVHQAYGENWDNLRVVRQTKQYNVGSLSFIDYAVPCFELASSVKTSPNDIATRLATLLQQTSHPEFRVEAVGGYLNFQLNEDYFDQVAVMAKSWFVSPTVLTPEKNHRYIIIGQSLPNETKVDLTNIFYYYLFNLSETLGTHISADYLLSDYSEATLAYLTELSSQNMINNQAKLTLPKHRRDILRLDEAGSLAQLRKEWKATQKNSYNVVAESSIFQEVQKYFDSLPGNPHSRGIIKDAATGASYYLEVNEATPLRSMSGLLYRAAYIVYLVDKGLLASEEGQKVVVVAPQKLHPLINDRAAYLQAEKGIKSSLVCFDPAVSQADILEIQTNTNSIANHLKQLSELLTDTQVSQAQDKNKRMALLSLVDVPLEFSQYLTSSQLPPLFDALNQTIRVQNLLGLKYSMQITAN